MYALKNPGRYILLLFLLFAPRLFSYGQDSIVIRLDTRNTDIEFDGIGAVSAGASTRLLIDYPEPMRSQILDYLFKPGFGAGFQHLKVEIGGDVNSTDGTEPSHMRKRGEENYTRGYEWWLMKEAKKRNPDIILDALVWGAPGWIGNGNFYSKDGAEYVAKFVMGAKTTYGLELNYVGIWNERDFVGSWIELLRKTLDDYGLQKTRIVANDAHNSTYYWEIADSVAVHPDLANAVDVLGVHYPDVPTPQTALEFQKSGKKIWASEDGEWHWETERMRQRYRLQRCNLNFIDRHLTKTEFWSPVTSYYDCLPVPGSGVVKANTPWSGAYEVLPATWLVAHTTQFASPGWKYLKDGCRRLPGGGSIVSLTDPSGKDVSLMIETLDQKANQLLLLQPAPGCDIRTLHVWCSDDVEQFVRDADVKLENGRFKILLKPNKNYTLTSTTGQVKGVASSPNPTAFPLPYIENFEAYVAGKTPKYLSDIGGAFETAKSKDHGLVLRQQIEQRGIDWAATPTAYSLLGEMNWNDVEISADVSFESLPSEPGLKKERFVSLIARCFPATFECFRYPNPVGYNFRLYGDGSWKLLTADRIIGDGAITQPGTGWYKMSLSCKENQISVLLNGKLLGTFTDNTYVRGLAGIGSDLKPALFDNLEIH